MTFERAKDELKKLADGRYHAIQYQLIEDAKGSLRAECYLYIDSRISVIAPTWNEALIGMRRRLGLMPEVSLIEMPMKELKDATL